MISYRKSSVDQIILQPLITVGCHFFIIPDTPARSVCASPTTSQQRKVELAESTKESRGATHLQQTYLLRLET